MDIPTEERASYRCLIFCFEYILSSIGTFEICSKHLANRSGYLRSNKTDEIIVSTSMFYQRRDDHNECNQV